MTYPPQQPPQQPGPYGQDPYGQQPQQGPYGQQPGQYGQYGQQPGPPGQYGQQPGYPGGPPPKKNTGMIVAIVVIAVLVLGGAGVGIYFLTKGDDKDSSASGDNPSETNDPAPNTEDNGEPTDSEPTGGNSGGSEEDLLAAAQEYADAVNDADESAATELTCDQTGPGSVYTITNSGGQSPGDVEVGNPTVLGNNTGTIDVTLADSSADPVPLLFEFKDDKWCVAV